MATNTSTPSMASTPSTQLVAGTVYRIKLTSGEWTDARYLGMYTNPGSRPGSMFSYRETKRYRFINLATGREIVIKSMQKVKAKE